MSVALVDHTGPWIADDAEALPDAGGHARFEVYEGGLLGERMPSRVALMLFPGAAGSRDAVLVDLCAADWCLADNRKRDAGIAALGEPFEWGR